MKRLLAICCGLVLIIVVGCQYSTGPATPVNAGPSEQDTQELREVKELLTKYGLTLETLRAQQEQQALLEREASGPPEVVRDIEPVRNLLASALASANLEKSSEAMASLSRLEDLLVALYADLPASEIITRCERALASLQLTDPKLEGAVLELTQAWDVARSPELPKLQPAEADALLQNAKGQVTAGQTQSAMTVIETVVQKCQGHWSLQTVADMLAGAAAAREAVERGKWKVVAAELMEMQAGLERLVAEGRLQLYEAPPATGAETAPTGAQPPTEGTPAPGTEGAAQPPAEGAAAPPAEGAASPAAGAPGGAPAAGSAGTAPAPPAPEGAAAPTPGGARTGTGTRTPG